MGSHAIYKERYPLEFDKFKYSDYTNRDFKVSSILAEYDNSILYSDYVINKIYKYFNDSNTVCIYLSDHGEELFNEKDNATHANTRLGLEIPFIVWVSDEYKENVYINNHNIESKYMTDDFIHTILDLAKIDTVDFQRSRSIISDNYNDKRRRMILKDYSTPIDYDSIYI